MPQGRLDILLVRQGSLVLGVAAEAVVALEEAPPEESLPSLLDAAGLSPQGTDSQEVVRARVHMGDDEFLQFALPRPFHLMEVALGSLQPVPPLLRPHIRLLGLAGVARHEDRPVAILDPVVIARKRPEVAGS